MGGIECYWWKFWRRLRALIEQLPRPVALAGGFEVATGGSALMQLMHVRTQMYDPLLSLLTTDGTNRRVTVLQHYSPANLYPKRI
jgi:hypothetical protein